MLRTISRHFVALAVLGLGLSAVAGRAADWNSDPNAWQGLASPQPTADQAGADPRDAAATEGRPFGNDADPNAANAAAAANAARTASPAGARPGAPWGIDAYGNPRPRPSTHRHRSVRLAANEVADPNQPSAAAPATADQSDAAGAPCESTGYWHCDYFFPVCGQWYGGSEFLLVRPHQTADTAYQVGPNGGSGSDIQNVNFNAPYDAAVRTFVGVQVDDTRSFRFTYTYIFDDTLRSAAVGDGSLAISPLGASLNPGDSINATQHLLLNLWDLESVNRLAIPDCICNGCPGWQVDWSWGVRIIDIDEAIKNEVDGPDASEYTQRSTFVGAGPRLGFELHRQLGQRCVSSFLAADAGLLLGSQETIGTNTPSGQSLAQIVPNFDIRLGLRWQPACGASISCGWMFETFGDATALSQSASLALVAPPQTSSLSYDGLFVRGEFRF